MELSFVLRGPKARSGASGGNTVVLKPSELSSSSALRIGELALEAGVPDGVLNIVQDWERRSVPHWHRMAM